jgi:hypothetical protein
MHLGVGTSNGLVALFDLRSQVGAAGGRGSAVLVYAKRRCQLRLVDVHGRVCLVVRLVSSSDSAGSLAVFL